MTDIATIKFMEPKRCQIDVRVYRKSDKHYWTCAITFSGTIQAAMESMRCWTSGLAIHPNLESVVVDAIRVLPNNALGFDHYTEVLRTFLDEKPYLG